MDTPESAGVPVQQDLGVIGNAHTLPLLGELRGLDEADIEWVREALLAFTEEGEDGEEETTELPRPQIVHLCETSVRSLTPLGRLADADDSTALSECTVGDEGSRVSWSVPHRTSARMDRKQTRERRRRLELNDSFKELVEVLSKVEAGEGLQAGGDKSWRDHPKGKRKAFRVAVLCRTVYALRYMHQAGTTLKTRITRLRHKLRSLGVTTDEEQYAGSKVRDLTVTEWVGDRHNQPAFCHVDGRALHQPIAMCLSNHRQIQPLEANSRSSSPSSLGSHASWPSISPLESFDPLIDNRVFSPLPLDLF